MGEPFVKRFALCYRTVVLSVLTCLSVTLVYMYCGQTIGWIKMKLGMEIGLGPRHIVLDGDPAPPNKWGHTTTVRSIFIVPVAKRSPISAIAELLFLIALIAAVIF